MSIMQRIKNALRGRTQVWGTSRMKQELWNKEFAEGHWGHIENTAGDCVYAVLERHGHNGDILDLGCGSGNTAVELPQNAYQNYHGVDISDVALQKAAGRSKENARASKNQFFQGDIIDFVPPGKYDIVMFRESLCYVPRAKVKATLDHYRHYLRPNGAFLVRLCDRVAYGDIITTIQANFKVIEKYDEPGSKTVVVVFR
jgi:SAM-dependent methyltransferase